MLFAEYLNQSNPSSDKISSDKLSSEKLSGEKLSSEKVFSRKLATDKVSKEEGCDKPAPLTADVMKAVVSSQDTQSCAIT